MSWVNYWLSIFRAFGLGKTVSGGQSSKVAPPPQPKKAKVEKKENQDLDKEENSGDTSCDFEFFYSSSDTSLSSGDVSFRGKKKKKASKIKVSQFNNIFCFWKSLILNVLYKEKCPVYCLKMLPPLWNWKKLSLHDLLQILWPGAMYTGVLCVCFYFVFTPVLC